jgi:hypothetical protein
MRPLSASLKATRRLALLKAQATDLCTDIQVLRGIFPVQRLGPAKISVTTLVATTTVKRGFFISSDDLPKKVHGRRIAASSRPVNRRAPCGLLGPTTAPSLCGGAGVGRTTLCGAAYHGANHPWLAGFSVEIRAGALMIELQEFVRCNAGMSSSGWSRSAATRDSIDLNWMNARVAENGTKVRYGRIDWKHLIRDEADFNRHIEYIHWNPVKHAYVAR